MTDYMISGLSALTDPADDDLLVIVDVSDTSTPPAGSGGSDKKVTVADLAAAIGGGSGTVTSVNEVEPVDGNVTLAAADVGALAPDGSGAGLTGITAAQVGLTAYPDQLPALEHGLTGVTGITSLLAAIASRNSARVDIPVIGDSITEGQGATVFASRWVAQAGRAIRAAYPATVPAAGGGLGFIPVISTGEASYTWPVTVASGAYDTTYTAAYYGPVRFSAQMTGATSFTYTAPPGTTSLQVAYYDTATAGTFTYQVNSGSATTVANGGTDVDILTSSIPASPGDVLTIAWASGTVYVTGLVHFAGDETAGVTFHGCGHFGWTVDDWLSTASYGYQTFAGTFPNAAAFGVMLGVNDSGSVTAATFGSSLTTLIADIRAAATALASLPVLLIIPYAPNHAYTDPGGWAAYAAAIRSVAAADTVGAHVIDLNYRLPAVASGWDGGALYADTDHPTNLGHALIGEIAAAGTRIA